MKTFLIIMISCIGIFVFSELINADHKKGHKKRNNNERKEEKNGGERMPSVQNKVYLDVQR